MQFLEKYLIFYSHFFLRVTRGAHNSNLQVPVVLKVDTAIHQINHYPVDSAIGFPDTYPVDGDLSSG